jgi:cell division inhibitor SulA
MTRIIKLQPVYKESKWNPTKIVPKLTLSGNWLQNAGFLPHKIIYVTVEKGRLVITSEAPL